MYNFVSSSFPTAKSHPRSKSLNKEADQSSILHSPPDKTPTIRIGKLSETNFAFLPNSTSKEYYCRSSRPPTGDQYGLSPNKNSLMISRSQSPFGFASPNSTLMKSVPTLHPPKSEKAITSTIYDGLKTQTRLFFSRSTTGLPPATDGKNLLRQNETPVIGFTPMASSRDPAYESYRDSASIGCSPRKRLAQQPAKMYNTNTVRLKDALRDSLQTLSKTRNEKNTERKSTERLIIGKKTQKNKNDERKSPALIALEKRMEEEKKIIENIGNASCEKFYSNLNLYNKYYAEYLQDPDMPFISQADLKVDVRPLIEETSGANEFKRLKAKKTNSIPKNLGNSNSSSQTKDINVEEETFKSGIIKPVSIKIGTGEGLKRGNLGGLKTVGWSNIDEREVSDKSTEEKWNLFGKDMVSVENNLKMLENMNNLISVKGARSEAEQDFFKAVKEGNEMSVHIMLTYNSDLVKAKDIRNQTPLHWAVKRNYIELIVKLDEFGADFEAIDMTGRKPLDLASGAQKREILNVLDQKRWQMKRKTTM